MFPQGFPLFYSDVTKPHFFKHFYSISELQLIRNNKLPRCTLTKLEWNEFLSIN